MVIGSVIGDPGFPDISHLFCVAFILQQNQQSFTAPDTDYSDTVRTAPEDNLNA
jgi:hypothetical protein